MPAGKAIAIAAMPTAVLMGLGLTPTLASAKDNPTKFSADDYKACADAIEAEKDGKTAPDEKETATPTPSPSASASKDSGKDTGTGSGSDSGSDDKETATPTPAPSATGGTGSGSDDGKDAATPTPSPSKTTNPLDPLGVGDALKDLLTPDEKETATPTPSPSASGSTASKDVGDAVKDTVDTVEGTVKDTTDKAGDAVKDTKDGLDKATEEAAKAAEEAKDAATPSPSASGIPDDCPVATDAAGADEDTPAQLPDTTWKLEASSLLLKGADYKGLVDVRMADGSTKRVMKYIISDGTDIGDLHQIAAGPNGKYFHIRADKGSTSTIRNGKTTMYTEELSGNLLGLIPMTFNAKNPPPINLPILYFTNVKVTQAAQFGGTLHVPGLHTTVEDS
ncbi:MULTISPECIES: hypothetical protein [Streptomyces]|uniref:hypothetical protein n=1 Tax=Streptomyces TaxID=1883 RepID=UPI0027E2248A|nr:hypothetical protein [Streptomyces longispororuber]